MLETMNSKILLTTKETARILGMGKSTLEQDRLHGHLGLPFVRLGRSVRYRREDVEAYISRLSSYTHTSAADADK